MRVFPLTSFVRVWRVVALTTLKWLNRFYGHICSINGDRSSSNGVAHCAQNFGNARVDLKVGYLEQKTFDCEHKTNT